MRSSNAKLEYVVEVFGLSWILATLLWKGELSIYLFLFIDDIDADKVGKGILELSPLLSIERDDRSAATGFVKILSYFHEDR